MIRRALATALLLAACGGDDGGGGTPDAAVIRMDMANTNKVVMVTCPATPAATVTTTATVDAYMPMSTTISVNGIVRFVMANVHDVTPNPVGGNINDPGLQVNPGQTKCLQFTQAGTYGFFCSPHGFSGTIVVN